MSSQVDINAFVQQLQQQLIATQQQLHQLKQDTINELKTNNNNTNNHNSNDLNKVLKPSKPPTFHGDRRSNAEVWLLELENYFTVINVMDGGQRIAFAVSQLRDLAVVWWKQAIQQAEQNPEIKTNWETFKKLLLDNYLPVSAAETSRAALYRLKQQGSVAAYCDIFLRHLNNVDDMNLADQMFLFKQGLQTYIAKEVNQKGPKTLAECMSFAQRAEIENRTYRNLNLEQKNRSFRNGLGNQFNINTAYNNGFNRYGTTNNSSNSYSVPMELNNINYGYQDYYSSSAFMEDSHLNDGLDTNDTRGLEYNNGNSDVGYEGNNTHHVNAVVGNYNSNRGPNSFVPRHVVTNNRVPGLTREQLDTYRRIGACFKCGQRGHMKSQCNNLNTNTGTNSTTSFKQFTTNTKK